MEQSVSTYKKIRRLYRQSQKYAASRMEQPELTQSELQLLRHVGFHGDQLLGRMLEKGKALAAAPAPEKEVRP